MKFRKFYKKFHASKINEAFYRKVKGYGDLIYVNPTKMEMNSVATSTGVIRFSAFAKEKKLYVWNGNRLHWEAGFIKWELGNPQISGVVKRKPNSSMWEFEESDTLWTLYVDGAVPDAFITYAKEILDTDWSWLEKYFTLTNSWQQQLNRLENAYENTKPSIRNKVKSFKKKY